MKHMKLVGLLTGIMSIGVLWGCQAAPTVVEVPVEKIVEVEKIIERPVEAYIEVPVDREVRVEVPGPTVYVDRTEYVDRPETPPENPLVPVTQKIIRRVEQNHLNITSFQYYISETIVLERQARDEYLTFTPTGEGRLTVNITREQVEIFPTTKGEMKNARDTADYISAIGKVTEGANGTISTIRVCFDETDKEKTLTFKKKPSTDRFVLDYDDEKGTIHYGGETYKVRMFTTREVPYLVVRFYEKINTEPGQQKPAGLPKGVPAASPGPAAIPASYSDVYSPEYPPDYSDYSEEYPEDFSSEYPEDSY